MSAGGSPALSSEAKLQMKQSFKASDGMRGEEGAARTITAAQ